MRRIAKVLAENVSTLVLLAGAAVASVGAGMIYLPAGFITGGVLVMAGAVISMLGEGDDT